MHTADWRIGAVLVAAASLLVFAGALGNHFAYDDVFAILADPRVAGGGSWWSIFREPYWTARGEEFGIYRPLVTLGFVADWIVSGGSPAWFHAVNLAWNALASVLVLLLLRRYFAPAAALAGALLFAVHPVHTEAVANIVGRAELMAATFMLGAGLVWSRTDGTARVLGVAVLFAAALLCKESAVMLPVLLILLDFADSRREPRAAPHQGYFRRNFPAFAALALVLAGWTVLRLSVLGGVSPRIVHPAGEVLSEPFDLFRTALLAWPEFLRLTLYPRTLLADYGPRILMPATEWNRGSLLGLAILFVLLAGGAVAVALRKRRTALGLLWFPVALLPASNLLVPIGTLVAERTLYLPSFSLAILAAAVWAHAGSLPARPLLVRAALATVVLLFAARTAIRVPEWRTTESVFAALARDRPDSYRARWYRARAIRAEQDAAAAHPIFIEAVELWPYRKGLVVEAIANAADAGLLPNARALSAHAVRVWPDDVTAQRLLAAISLDLGDSTTAAQAAADGLALDPSDELLRRILDAVRQAGGKVR